MSHARSIFLTRHGQRIDHVNKEWKSVPGNPGSLHLSPHGIEQARALGQRLRSEGIRRIFASPFYRTVETAHYVAEQLDVPICIERGVCEYLQPRYFPRSLEVPTPEALAERFDRIDLSYRTFLSPEPPEDHDRLYQRAQAIMPHLLEIEPGPFLIVSHGAVARFMCSAVLGEIQEQMRTSIECAATQLVCDEGGWRVQCDGDDSHLPPDPHAAEAAHA